MFSKGGLLKAFLFQYCDIEEKEMIKHVAFDFDGTLADSVEFCLAVFDKVFAKYMGEKAPDREAI